jgi:non-canonical purine NTP pyrophosphatase (RdgB/HAM1 family)
MTKTTLAKTTKTIYFATGNQDKLKEAREILTEYNVEQIKIDLPELQGEPLDVAREKAKLAYEKVKKPIFVDDTGLAFHAFKGMPGIYIKHFLHALGQDGLVKMLAGFKDKSATAFASIGYCDGKETKVFIGKCEGKIVRKLDKGFGFGFGWDPIFSPDGYKGTFASIPTEIKNKISHRRNALDQFHAFLKTV